MAKLIRQRETRYILTNDAGDQIGSLGRTTTSNGYQMWRFEAADVFHPYYDFVTPAECVRWLQNEQGLQVELIEGN